VSTYISSQFIAVKLKRTFESHTVYKKRKIFHTKYESRFITWFIKSKVNTFYVITMILFSIFQKINKDSKNLELYNVSGFYCVATFTTVI